MTRYHTNKILEMYDEGLLDARQLIRDLLMWMDEGDVVEFYDKNIDDYEEEDAEAEEEEWTNPKHFMEEWTEESSDPILVPYKEENDDSE